jgi:aminoglycoside 6'-N-acetyltransferase
MSKIVSFRPLARTDFSLLQRWLVEPHVLIWWREPLDRAGVHAKYGPRVDGTDPTHVFLIVVDGRSIGWIQWYRWSDYSAHALELGADMESAGMDLAIGERSMMGKGLGSDVIRQFIDEIIFVDSGIRSVVTDPQENNLRSLHAFEKAGFTIGQKVKLTGENFQRCVVRLDRPA